MVSDSDIPGSFLMGLATVTLHLAWECGDFVPMRFSALGINVSGTHALLTLKSL